MFEWKEQNYGFSACIGPIVYFVFTYYKKTEIDTSWCFGNGSYAPYLSGHLTIDEAKAWCESHYRGWYKSLPVPLPQW